MFKIRSCLFGNCPKCGSTNIITEAMSEWEMDADLPVSQTCQDCKHEWMW